MWERTKRLINSYLDDMIEKVSSPDKGVRQVTRADIARLNELEVQARAATKMLEKELAEIELKMIGVSERERMSRERGDEAVASSTSTELVNLSSHRDLLKQQIGESRASAARAKALREQRRSVGEELANETHLTSMRENIAGLQSPFDATDPAATIDEMRGRLNRVTSTESLVAEADRELEVEKARSVVDELLLRYKQGVTNEQPERASETPRSAPSAIEPSPPKAEEKESDQSKTLGRNEGPLRPID